MKKFLIAVFTYMLTWVIIYLLISFVKLELNPINWGQELRANVAVFFGFFFGVLIIIFICLEMNDNENK